MSKLSTADVIRHINVDSSVTIGDEQLKALQNILLGILEDIQRVCEEEDYRYVLCGGSALGAVRHQGFIPWDDDIDVMMPREDYDKFIQAFRVRFSDKYWVHIPGQTDDYALLMTHIRLKGTSVKTRDDFNTNECGACIDVFPVENTYDGKFKRNIHGIGCMYYGFMVSCRKFFRDRKPLKAMAKSSGNRKFAFTVRTKILIGAIAAIRSVNKWVNKADKWNSKYKNCNSNLITIPSGREHFFGALHQRSNIYNGADMVFEGKLRKVPANYDVYLQRLYGNYNIIPEESKREKHIYFEPFDLG